MKKGSPKRYLISLIVIFFISSVSYAKISDDILNQKKSVITIYIYEKNELKYFGSGFLIHTSGIAVTNHHVLAPLLSTDKYSIAIKMENGDLVKAQKIMGFDKDNDVALIKLEGNNLPAVKLASDYKPKQGEDIVVIGSPYGLETTVSNGIISSIRGKDEFLQITAPISPGSSGSPVFNYAGDVIGVATLIIQGGQNLNFAIPVKYIEGLQKSIAAPNEKLPSLTNITLEEIAKRNVQENTPEYHINRAKEYFANNQNDEAVEEYTKAIALKPDDASLYSYRGQAQYLLQHKKEAVEDYSKAISHDPKNGFYYYQRYTFHAIEGNNELALSDINKAIDLKKFSRDLDIFDELYSIRGAIYIHLGQYDNALKDYANAIKISPNVILDYPFALLVPPDKYNDCIEFLTKMIPLRPEDGLIYAQRADFYTELKQYDKAIKDISKTIELNPHNLHFYAIRSNLFFQKGDRKKAKGDLQKLCYWENPSTFSAKIIERSCNRLAEIEKDEERGVKWKLYSKSDTGSHYYDSTSIKPHKPHLRVWTRSEQDAKSEVEERKKEGLPINGFEDYSHTVDLREIDCAGGETGIVSIFDYSKQGRVLQSLNVERIKMRPIIPDTVGESLYEIVCKTKNKGR